VQWSRRHHLRLDTARAPAWWTCDPALVRIALSNLVDNAVKHARPGEITLSAHSPAPGLLALAVSDQGPGLLPEAAQHLFARYERGASHGCTAADVQATASAQGGTCFTLTLASGGAAASAGRSSFNS
jgi:signal transduction histidine kinase